MGKSHPVDSSLMRAVDAQVAVLYNKCHVLFVPPNVLISGIITSEIFFAKQN